MSVFNYVAVTENGKTHKGILEGNSTSHVRKLLNDRGLIPIEITLADSETAVGGEEVSGWTRLIKRKRRISISHLSVITYQFSTLLAAGIPVESALASIVAEIDNSALKQVLLSVRSKVLEGNTLADSMKEYPYVFPKLYTASIAVGEKTGQLDNVLYRLADYYENQRAVQDKIFQALIYPTLLTVVSGTIIIFLLVYVIPQVTTVFTQTGQTLPGITLFLLAITDFIRDFGMYVLLFILVSFVAFRYALRNVSFCYRVQSFLLKIPFLNQAIIAINSARFLRTFGILFAAGVPVLDAMSSASSIINLLPMRRAIAEAITKVAEGASIHLSLQSTGFFSSLSNQLIASGEASGEIEVMLEKAAAFQEKNTAYKLNTLLALFEPILILTMGCIVLMIVLAVLLPIFEMNQLIR